MTRSTNGRTLKGLITMLLASAMLFACGGNENEDREKQIEAMAKEHGFDADVTLDESGEVASATFNNANGTQIGKNLKLPNDFPSDVPVSDEWVIMAVSPMQGGYMINATATDSSDELLAGVRQQLTAAGWTETAFAQPAPVMTQIGFSKDDRITNLNFMDTGDNRNVQLVTMPNPN